MRWKHACTNVAADSNQLVMETMHKVAARHGMVGGLPFLAKPVNLHEVLGCLERHLGGADGNRRDLHHDPRQHRPW